MKRSVSPTIATILLIVIAVSLAGLIYAFLTGMFNGFLSFLRFQASSQSQYVSFSTIDAYCINNQIYFIIYNNGNSPITTSNLIVMINQNGEIIQINNSYITCTNNVTLPNTQTTCYIADPPYICVYYPGLPYNPQIELFYGGMSETYDLGNGYYVTSFNNLLKPLLPPQANETLAPHLYEWLFYEGANNYVLVPNSVTTDIYPPISIIIRFVQFKSQYGGDEVIYSKDLEAGGSGSDWSGYLFQECCWGEINFAVSNGSNPPYPDQWPLYIWIPYWYSVDTWYTLTYNIISTNSTSTYVGGFIDNQSLGTYTIPTNFVPSSCPLFIGRRCWWFGPYMLMSYFIEYDTVLNSTEVNDIYSYYLVPDAQNLVIFLDPTFYSSQYNIFVDLSGNGNNGYPNDLTWIPTYQANNMINDNAWIWIIQGLNNDNMVDLTGFPPDTFLVFNNGTAVNIQNLPNAAQSPYGWYNASVSPSLFTNFAGFLIPGWT